MESKEEISSTPAPYHEMPMASANRSMEASLTLPLPIELRREIFQHLLIGRNVRDQDGKYHFYTSVLGVNSAFYQEASEMLYKENIFAVIQHAAMNNFGVLAMLQVHAIASPHHLKNHFKAHRICITVQYDQDIPASLEEGLEGQGIVIHADDLKGYIKWLKLSCHEVHQRHMPTILSPTGARPLVLVNMHEGSQPHQLHIRINLRSSVLGRATEKQQRMLMAPFQDVAGAQHVNIIGMDSLVVEMKRHMLPQVVSYQAVGWDLVKTVQSIKKDLDRLSSNTDTTAQRACRGYQWLLASLRITNLSRSAPVRRESHTGWPDALAVIACDIWNSWRVLQVRCQDVGLYHSGTEYVSGWCDLLKERGTTTAVFSSKRRLQQRLLNAALFTFTGQCHQALACFHNAFRFADSVGLTPSREALHDFLIVEKHCNSNRSQHDRIGHTIFRCGSPALTPATSHLGLDTITMAQLSPELFMQPPSNLVGWRDMDERYNKEDLEALGINKWTDLPELLAK